MKASSPQSRAIAELLVKHQDEIARHGKLTITVVVSRSATHPDNAVVLDGVGTLLPPDVAASVLREAVEYLEKDADKIESSAAAAHARGETLIVTEMGKEGDEEPMN